MNPKVSVIIPTYNSLPFIQETLTSILAQQAVALEVIVVDDGSRDGTPTHIEQQFGNKVRLLQQPNAGSAAARNTGLQQAVGEFVLFCDADDTLILPTTLASLVDHLTAHPQASGVYSAWQWVDPQGQMLREEIPWAHAQLLNPTDYLLMGQFRLNALLLRRQVALVIGGFPAWKYVEDVALFAELARHEHTLAWLPMVGAAYRLHADSLSHSQRVNNVTTSRSLWQQLAHDLPPELSQPIRETWFYRTAYWLLRMLPTRNDDLLIELIADAHAHAPNSHWPVLWLAQLQKLALTDELLPADLAWLCAQIEKHARLPAKTAGVLTADWLRWWSEVWWWWYFAQQQEPNTPPPPAPQNRQHTLRLMRATILQAPGWFYGGGWSVAQVIEHFAQHANLNVAETQVLLQTAWLRATLEKRSVAAKTLWQTLKHPLLWVNWPTFILPAVAHYLRRINQP